VGRSERAGADVEGRQSADVSASADDRRCQHLKVKSDLCNYLFSADNRHDRAYFQNVV
jgi:hypothetical protein